jgi:ParB-like chromosome segregation protein Spo0J
MNWDDSAARPVALADLGQKYRRYRLADPEAESALVESLRRWGQLSALVACERDGKLELLDGFKRYTAAAAMGLATLSVRVLEVDERLAKAAILGLNRGQRGVRELEEAWIVQDRELLRPLLLRVGTEANLVAERTLGPALVQELLHEGVLS